MLPSLPLNAVDCSSGIAGDNFFEYVRTGKITAHKTKITRYTSEGVELANRAEIKTDIVIFGTGFRQDISFLPEKYRQKILNNQGYFQLYRHLIHPEIPNLGFVGYNTSFFSQLTSEVGAWWLLDYIEGYVNLPSKSEMEAEIQADFLWMQKQLNKTNEASGACISPQVLNLKILAVDTKLCIGAGDTKFAL